VYKADRTQNYVYIMTQEEHPVHHYCCHIVFDEL